MSLQYAQLTYGQEQYGTEGIDYVIALMDSIVASDIVTKIASKSLQNSITQADAIVKSLSKLLRDGGVISADIAFVISKGFEETIRLHVWLTPKRTNLDDWRD